MGQRLPANLTLIQDHLFGQTLRTFKPGPVGYDWIHYKSVKLSPLGTTSLTYGDLYIPFGRYELTAAEVRPFQEYADLLFKVSEPAMDLACSRLSDAEIRVHARDRLVDAVIGMEALLLAGLPSEDRRGELKYRFSLHYSTLFSSPEERYCGFKLAKDLYDLRSAIAHGSGLREKVRVGERMVTLEEAAGEAAKALRNLIGRFLPHVKEAPYKKHEYWDQSYFGLREKK